MRLFLATGLMLALCIGGCTNEVAQENLRQLQMQQAELQQMQRELETLRAQIAGQTSSGATAATQNSQQLKTQSGCDTEIANKAVARGSEAMRRADYKRAVAYYQDALSACPNRAETEFSLGQAYEAMGQLDFAREHYRKAEELAVQNQPDLAKQARKALVRVESE